MTLQVICVSYQQGSYFRPLSLRILIDSFMVQTNPNWILKIIHDGPAPDVIRGLANSYGDPRISYEETPQVNGYWGHVNRGHMLRKIALNHRDYVLMTNDDNYYVPSFVEYMLRECRSGVGMVYCDTVHSYEKYNVLISQVKENHIDMGSFIVKLDVAKKVGFNHVHLSADGTYAVECANYCRRVRLAIRHLEKPIFVHN